MVHRVYVSVGVSGVEVVVVSASEVQYQGVCEAVCLGPWL